MEKTFCVYMHINTVNGKRYIGQTCQKPVYGRWHSDGSGYVSNDHFTKAIKKYGWDAFKHIIILDGLTLQEADMAESLLIDMFDTMNQEKGYNKKHGGNNGFMSEEAKRKISLANKGRKPTAESLAKFSETRKGHKVSESTRAILREKCSGWHHTEDERRKISEKNTGKHWYNNGVENAFCFECPDGFTVGMIFKDKDTMAQKKREHFSRTKWYTDGTRNIRAIECPNGFREGRIFDAKKHSVKNHIRCIETGIVYQNAHSAERETGINFTSILRCCKGIYQQTHGFHFEYAKVVNE